MDLKNKIRAKFSRSATDASLPSPKTPNGIFRSLRSADGRSPSIIVDDASHEPDSEVTASGQSYTGLDEASGDKATNLLAPATRTHQPQNTQSGVVTGSGSHCIRPIHLNASATRATLATPTATTSTVEVPSDSSVEVASISASSTLSSSSSSSSTPSTTVPTAYIATATLPKPIKNSSHTPHHRRVADSLLSRLPTLLPHAIQEHAEQLLPPLNAAQLTRPTTISTRMMPPMAATGPPRRIWIKRPGASATQISICDDDLVDDVRDKALKKYHNSLGRQFDAPDLSIRLVPREQLQERTLAPDEPIARTLDAYYAGGQTMDEALIIYSPPRRTTPRPSPRTSYSHGGHATAAYYGNITPTEGVTDYFGPVAPAQPHLPIPVAISHNANTHSLPKTVLSPSAGLGQMPSPGGTRTHLYSKHRSERPKLGRQHTSSPMIINMAGGAHGVMMQATASNHGTLPSHSRGLQSHTHSNASELSGLPPSGPPPIHTPPMPQDAIMQHIVTPSARGLSPRQSSVRSKKKQNIEHLPASTGLLNGGVPPINVLIVEDNIINLKLLEAFVKKLKVRWQTAMNGKEAVSKWRSGGFHLVLMDIQLPVMSGLDATREIRRLERLNSIGVFSSSPSASTEELKGEVEEQDQLEIELFKSPVIIVALTASSLQSDRHEALAAGCNDFLTKPVNFEWLERKVTEWGCMQALVDFDGWRTWKNLSLEAEENEAMKRAAKVKTKKHRQSMTFVT